MEHHNLALAISSFHCLKVLTATGNLFQGDAVKFVLLLLGPLLQAAPQDYEVDSYNMLCPQTFVESHCWLFIDFCCYR